MCGGVSSWACRLVSVSVCQCIGASSSWCVAILVRCRLGASSSGSTLARWCIGAWRVGELTRGHTVEGGRGHGGRANF
jgi:hypothetical protein